MLRVFISYRRDDTRHLSARVYEQFEPTFGDSVFFDVDTLPRFAGLSFPEIIRRTVPQCQVFLAIIGPQWGRLMQKQLNDPQDFVQIEVGLALETEGVRVIPVLVDGAPMPRPDELPPRLRGLVDRQAVVLPQDPHFRNAVREFARNLAASGTPPPKPADSGEQTLNKPAVAEEARWVEMGREHPGATWRDRIPGLPQEACPEMVTIPSGQFLMGSPKNEKRWLAYDGSEEPQHEVRISYLYALGKYPVTFAEWDSAIAGGAKLERPLSEGWGRDRRPVINVNWNDARAYIDWLNDKLALQNHSAYRLPSESEWEYACRANTATPFSFGSRITKSHAQFSEESFGSARQSAPVGTFPANAFGLHDMHGNVWEWCEDTWKRNYKDAPQDGSVWLGGDAERRVLRGGSWSVDPARLRSASRINAKRTERDKGFGFRLAKTISPLQS